MYYAQYSSEQASILLERWSVWLTPNNEYVIATSVNLMPENLPYFSDAIEHGLVVRCVARTQEELSKLNQIKLQLALSQVGLEANAVAA